MASPIYNSASNQPQGLETLTIDSVTYVLEQDTLDAIVEKMRLINRMDANGDAADFMIRASGEQVQFEITVQRAATTTVAPPMGTEFSWDFDRSGTASTFVTGGDGDLRVGRGKSNMDTFTFPITLVTYQG